jgi:uncharacterized membrane protein
MSACGHLWAIGYDGMEQAEQLRQKIVGLGQKQCLVLHDTAVVVRYGDGSVTLDGEPFMAAPHLGGHTLANFLAALSLGAPPLTGGAACALAGRAHRGVAETGIDNDFIKEVGTLMKPGTSALFVLDQACDMPTILEEIRGMGGTVLKTNVDLERTKLIQSTLAAPADNTRSGSLGAEEQP